MKQIYYAMALIVLSLAGCAAPRMTSVSETMTLKEPPVIARPQEVQPQLPAEPAPVRDAGRFSLSVRDADVRDVFLLLSKDSGVNIIADKDVTGRISVDFSNLELTSALYAVTRQLGFTFWQDRGFIRVSRPVLATRTFRINYITGKRSSTSTMNAAISAGESGGGMSAGRTTNISISTASGSTDSGGSAPSSAQGNVTVTTSGTSDFWKEVTRGLEVIVFGDAKGSSGEGGLSRGDEKSGKKLVISELAGVVHVTDFSDNLDRVARFIEDVEEAVRRQVMIQAHVVEVSLNDGFRFGIDWELLAGSGKGNRSGTGGSRELLALAQELAPNPLTRVFEFQLSHKKINLLLDAMKEQGQVSVLSSPKVSTMNNQKAVIKLTTKEVSWVTNSFLNADGSVLLSYTSPQVDEVGLFLDVTPQVDIDGFITMQIHPSISEKVKDSVSPDGKSTKPVIDVREVDTMIRTRSGQTIVIAGLITDRLSDGTRRVPILGEIPVVGTLFTQTVQEKKKAELVILMTPYLLNERSIEEIRQVHEERLKRAGRAFEAVPALESRNRDQ